MRPIFFWMFCIAVVSAFTFSLYAQTSSGITKHIICSTLDGWMMKFNGDGSASISYGSLPIDQARVAAGIFEIQLVEELIRPIVKESSNSYKRVAVNVFKSGQTSSIASYADESMPFQSLCRKVLLNSAFADIERFRLLVAQHPPFGIDGSVIKKDQASKDQPKILQPVNAASESNQEEEAIVGTTSTPISSPVLQTLPSKAPEAKPTLPKPSEEPASSTPWSILVVLIVTVLGLLLYLLKLRS
jgi:hypothetical protein